MRGHSKTIQFSISLILFVAITQFACAGTFERDISRDFVSQPGKSLEIHTGSGAINVRSGDNDSVLIQVKLSVKASSQEKADEFFDAVEVNLSESETGVQATVKSNKSSFWGWIFGSKPPSVEVFAICPESSNLVLDTGSGDISVVGISGDIVLDTGSGNISGSDLAGPIDSDTGSGDIILKGIDGNFTGDTGSGSIKVHDLNGTFNGDTGSGSIIAKGAIPQFSARTGSGSVVIESTINDPLQSSVSAGSGNIDIYLPISANAQFTGSTNSGAVRADFPNAAFLSNSKKAVDLVLNNNGALISAQAGSGDVSLYPGAPQ